MSATPKTSVASAAAEYLARGWPVVPIPYRQKRPIIERWETLRLTSALVPFHFGDTRSNIGVILGTAADGLVDVNLDASEARALADEFLPTTGAEFGRPSSRRSHRFYHSATPIKRIAYRDPSVADDADQRRMLVELRGDGCQTVVPPSTHESGEPIEWVNGATPRDVEADALGRAVSKLAAAALLARHFPVKGSRNDTALALAGALLRAGWSDDEAEHFIAQVATVGGSEDVPAKVLTVRATRAKLEVNGKTTGLKKLKTLLDPKVVDAVAEWLQLKPRKPVGSPTCTDAANGDRFADQHGQDARYAYPWKSWIVWDGRRWTRDEHGGVERRAQATARLIHGEAARATDLKTQRELSRWAVASQARPRLEAMPWAARARLFIRPDAFDRQPYLLNTLNGTLDLRTTRLQPHRREDLLTKLAPVVYDAEAQCPGWLKFLQQITRTEEGEDDPAMVEYLAVAVGYTLLGLTEEQCLFLLHGRGKNGKSTFLELIRGVLGDYARPAEFRMLLDRPNSDAIRNDLAALQGLRMVTAIESGRGRRLNEPLIKELTGSDKITARFLYAEYFDFYPEFKLWLAANDKPEIRGVDEGIWRRVKLLPFEVTIPPAERDRQMPAKLRRELPGILAWAVRGCLAWQQNGLIDPERVRVATEAYRVESDALAGFIEIHCDTARSLGTKPEELLVSAADLYFAYERWCMAAGEQPWQKNTFGTAMGERGFRAANKWAEGCTQRMYVGIALKPAEAAAARRARAASEPRVGSSEPPRADGEGPGKPGGRWGRPDERPDEPF